MLTLGDLGGSRGAGVARALVHAPARAGGASGCRARSGGAHAIEGVDAMGQPYLQEINVCIYGSESMTQMQHTIPPFSIFKTITKSDEIDDTGAGWPRVSFTVHWSYSVQR